MWTRKHLKSRAWEMLRTSYWKAFLVSLIMVIVGGNNGQLFNFNWNLGGRDFPDLNSHFASLGGDMFWTIFIVFLIIIILVILAILAFRIFLGYPLEVGGRRYFIQSAQNNVDLNCLGYSFDKTKYLDIVKSMLWRALINFLWFLLLIIPGIVKTYAFRMVPYILADNPNIGYKRALELSEKMTHGHKFDIFILDLSFIGWYLLGTLAFFIGVLFVLPYVNATNAELYLVLRQSALDNQLCSYDELLINPI